MRRHAFLMIATLLLPAATTAAAQGVAFDYNAVFPERQFDFGTVARGSKVRHAFRVVNNTPHEIHIASWRTKCGCTEVRVGARDIPPGTQTVVEATVDTTKFQGYKASGLVLVLDRPYGLEVDLNLTCFIRTDVTLSPGGVDFGVVTRSSQPTARLVLNYAGGRPDWQIVKMQTISPAISAKVQEIGRNGGAAQYEIVATLSPTAPTGFLKEEITLFTNDPASPTIPISVAAAVQPGVTVSPAILNLGRVKPGQVVTKTVTVRSSKAAAPFKLTEVRPDRDGLSGQAASDEARPYHTVTVTLKAPDRAGPFNAALEIGTDVQGEPPARLTAFATVEP